MYSGLLYYCSDKNYAHRIKLRKKQPGKSSKIAETDRQENARSIANKFCALSKTLCTLGEGEAGRICAGTWARDRSYT